MILKRAQSHSPFYHQEVQIKEENNYILLLEIISICLPATQTMNLKWPLIMKKYDIIPTKLTSNKEGDLQEHWHLCYQKRNYRVSSQPIQEKPSSILAKAFPYY